MNRRPPAGERSNLPPPSNLLSLLPFRSASPPHPRGDWSPWNPTRATSYYIDIYVYFTNLISSYLWATSPRLCQVNATQTHVSVSHGDITTVRSKAVASLVRPDSRIACSNPPGSFSVFVVLGKETRCVQPILVWGVLVASVILVRRWGGGLVVSTCASYRVQIPARWRCTFLSWW